MKYCEENPNSCLNGGKCTSLTEDEGLFKCECPSAFKGKRCEIVPSLNSTISTSTSTSRPPPSTSTKLPSNQETTDESELDDELTTAENSSESDVVEAPSVEEIDNEA